MDGLSEKVCSDCGAVKDAGEFYSHKNTADGLYPKCKPCVSLERRAYYLENRKAKLEARAKYRREHPEKFKASKAASYERRKPDVLKARQEYSRTPAARLSISLDGYKRRRRSYGLPIFVEPFTVEEFLLRNEWGVCSECGDTGEIEIDHITPVCQHSSRHSLENLRLLCYGCHRFRPRQYPDGMGEHVDD